MREEARGWWLQALHDLEAAKKNLDSGIYFLTAFAAHQAAQKALKAAIIEMGRTLPAKLHSLLDLAKGLEETARLDVAEIRDALRELSPHYFTARYPDAAGGVPADIYNRKVASRLVKSAEKVVEWLKRSMKA